ncbi:uncharacterized protein PITG_07207 [Phytophthora infestans T30-4]|uniref:Uncharacterized protein n=1 Tax=Phytophthora infestans (strain T30-4) TaxID=403677 RepID=D0N7I6_PHYIT|nr:uncharacterized protein PITG_07207 [Phytophthora infestans T30-4]EEY53535.1 hypothetical protein PITG_07207 [Phytophthora infestans T30-4]|eukprot:XP_002905153.1 hypothetical protein PITG_07207 [Phytophthora infestans T30-4]
MNRFLYTEEIRDAFMKQFALIFTTPPLHAFKFENLGGQFGHIRRSHQAASCCQHANLLIYIFVIITDEVVEANGRVK